MFTKFASLDVIDVKSAPSRVRSASLSKLADFNDYRTDDGYIYVRVRAISSRVNKNHDGWPSEELQKSYRTFIGKPIFVDHHNSDPKKARGVIVDAALHVEDAKTSSLDPYYASAPENHLPPTWIELLLEVDAKKFPKLAKAIVNGDIDGVSMGANVEMSKCSHCGNEATSPEQFCKHIQSKGAYFDYYTPDGTKTSKRSYEDCHGVGFFEISFVFDPADETALVSDIKKSARIAAIRAEADVHESNKYIKQHGDKWVIVQKGTGKVLSEHDSEEKAEASFRAMEMHKHEGAKTAFADIPSWFMQALEVVGGVGALVGGTWAASLWDEYRHIMGTNPKPIPLVVETIKELGATAGEPMGVGPGLDTTPVKNIADKSNQSMLSKTADQNDKPQAEMTSVPQKVNTLRQEQECPICGSTMEDGECAVCNYIEPPEGFDNPNLEKAKEVDQQIHQQDAQQAAQGLQGQPNDVVPGEQGDPEIPSGGMPAGSGVMSSTGNNHASYAVSSERTKTSASNGGRINTQERPILPVTRQLSDKPIAPKVIQDAKKPVESNSKETMTQTQKVADGVKPKDPAVQPEKRVDVEGVGGFAADVDADKQVDVTGVGSVSGDPLSGIEHENVEKNTGDFVAPHTDTWSNGEGDSLGQQDPVTSETGDFFTVSHNNEIVTIERGTGRVIERKTADSSADLGGPMGEGVEGGSAKEGGPTWDTSDAGFPDHQPARVDLAAPLKEEVGEGTKTWSGTDGFADPITSDSANEVGGPIGVAVAKAKAHQLLAFKIAETESEMGLIEKEARFDRVAELEELSEDALKAQIETLARVKTAGLKKNAPAQKTAGRVPSMRPVTASFEIEAHSVSDSAVEDVIGW